jgi:Ca2+-binding EF-hand superfamily protein
MGNIITSLFVGGNDRPYSHSEAVAAGRIDFELLKLQEPEIGKIYMKFLEIDIDVSGEIDFEEFIHFFKLEKNEFVERIFTLFDVDKCGRLDFKEFVLTLYNFCTLKSPALGTYNSSSEFAFKIDFVFITCYTSEYFAFEIYDGDYSGALELEEVTLIVSEIFGKDYEDNKAAIR